MAKLFITLASLSGMLAVTFGAFGAHALRDKLDNDMMGVFETAVQYHFYHSLALLAVGVIALSQPQTVMLKSAGWLFLSGIAVFSGSLYILAITGHQVAGCRYPFGRPVIHCGLGVFGSSRLEVAGLI